MNPSPSSPPYFLGARELKTRLGTYLRMVERGQTFLVTERGRPVAELRPIRLEGRDLDSRLDELAASGLLLVAESGPMEAFEPVSCAGNSGSEAVIEDREDRF